MTNNSQQSSNAVQSTFTKQKRELAKANALIASIRAQEKRTQRYAIDGKLETEERLTYVPETPVAIANKVLEIVEAVVRQHGARQRANGVNTGRFEFGSVAADLTVPQLRALQDASVTLRNLVEKLPAENRRLVPNGEVDGRPAFLTPLEPVVKTKTRTIPYEEKDSTRVRTYTEEYEEVLYQTREVTIDYGLPLVKLSELQAMIGDLDTAIQVAIDDANAKARDDDPVLNDVVAKIVEAFRTQIDA